MNGHLMASCVRNIHTKNYQDLVIGLQVTVENVGDAFCDTVCNTKTITRTTTTNNNTDDNNALK